MYAARTKYSHVYHHAAGAADCTLYSLKLCLASVFKPKHPIAGYGCYNMPFVYRDTYLHVLSF